MATYAPPYTSAQLDQYFALIELPAHYLPSAKPALNLAYLTALHVHQISAIPYENLVLHYSPIKEISLDPQHLFDKFVTRKYGRGGYCMEDTLFFLFVLQSLGFDAYPTGVRIRLRDNGVPKGNFTGLVHIVLIVTLPEPKDLNTPSTPKYIIDVAFGGDGPTSPLPLLPENITTNLGTQQNRYIHAPLPLPNTPSRPLTPSPQNFWQYQYRNSPGQEWNTFYAFTETEFLLRDFEVMSFYTSAGKTFQRTTILVVKFLRDGDRGAGVYDVLDFGDEGDGGSEESGDGGGAQRRHESRITGKLMLVNGALKRNLGGQTEIVQQCWNEKDRIEVLREWFGITLTREEIVGISGLDTQLRN